MAAILTTSACENCGFVTYLPRPEASDIERKYRYLNANKETATEFSRALPSDRPRSYELFRKVETLLLDKPSLVLDFGGGNGRLLYKFVEEGHHCYVSDYVDCVIEGANFLGPDIDLIASRYKFDVAICSHVIEHVADPVSVLRSLAPAIRQGGHLYVEVPLELWKRVPPKVDPVTHVNFFTRESLRTTLEVAGFQVITCLYETFIRPNGRFGIAVKAIAKPGRASCEPTVSGLKPVYDLLRPSLFMRLKNLVVHPRLFMNLVQSRGQR